MKKATYLLLLSMLVGFKPMAQVCQTFTSTSTPLTIPEWGDVTATINVAGITGNITDVNVESLSGTHGYVYDLTMSLEHPDGTTRVMFQNICDDEENFNLKFDDQSSQTYADFNPGPQLCNANTGLYYQPKEFFSAFNGKTATGIWKLNINDGFPPDPGILQSFSIHICTDGILPITLSDFSAEYLKEKDHVELNWDVAAEHNVSHFEIWRSTDEDRDFELIGFNDFKQGNKEYAYTDSDIKKGHSYYYKLKTMDYDDSFQWSKIASATTGASDLFTEISPNPFTHSLNVSIAIENDENLQFNLYDVGGKLITSSKGNFSEKFEWDLSYLESGIYIFEILTPLNRQVQRVIKM